MKQAMMRVLEWTRNGLTHAKHTAEVVWLCAHAQEARDGLLMLVLVVLLVAEIVEWLEGHK